MQNALPQDNTHPLRDEQIAQFKRDGYLMIANLFDAGEVELMIRVARRTARCTSTPLAEKTLRAARVGSRSGTTPATTSSGLSRGSRRIVDAMEQLLGGEVYHYHSKLMLKEPFVGGAWEWHQDYGYWYQNGCLFPCMASCLIALDAANRANGCLQVLKGSHHMGRVEHGRFGDQTGADPERVQAARQRLEHVYCEAAPGSGLFFHGNLLHASDANTSPYVSLVTNLLL